MRILLFLAIAAGAGAQGQDSFHQLLDRVWQFDLRESPEFASTLGDRRYNNQWSDVSPAAFARRNRELRAFREELKDIDRSKLSADDQLNYDLFARHLDDRLEFFEHKLHLLAVNQRGGIQTSGDLAARLRFTSTKDYEDWIARLRSFPVKADQTTTLLREGIRQKMLLPKIILERIPGQIDREVEGETSFYKPFKTMPSTIPRVEQDRLREQASAAIRERVVPALVRFRDFLVREYIPASFDQVGIWQTPDGARVYSYTVRSFTTANLTPDQVHETGLAEVKRIRAAMEDIKSRTGFSGSLKEFFHFLRTSPQFYYKSPEELLAAYRAMAKRIDPHLVKVFRTLPRMPYGVEPIPAAIAPDTTTAYYSRPAHDGTRAGTYFVNLYQPETRPKYEMLALSLHEAVPGHHLQIALAQEQAELPVFRRNSPFTAFVEGWGLYAESLGEEMGLYADDLYSRFGQLTYEMWRAVRLVVDTGMHHKRWTREQAIDYFLDNAAKTELDVVNEIDRYIAWPGQALAYKIGEIKIKELRAAAEKKLGPKFDLREFHEALLSGGAVPLDVLETRINAWLGKQ